MNSLNRMIGKTIASATVMKDPGYVDEPYLKLEFTDGSEIILQAWHTGEFSTEAKDEYPVYIGIADKINGLVPVIK